MNDPLISIDRASKSWAVFDGPNKVHGFVQYEIEQAAVNDAKAFVKTKTSKEPRIVYPRITRYARS